MRKKKLNKLFIASAATVVAASGVAAPSPANANSTFPDVKTSDYFYNAVMELSERGVIKGFEDGTFRPNNNVTRGQAAVIIAGVLGLNTNNVTNPGFKDVPTSHPYYGAISALANAGYINGFEDGTFGATQPITRNQMAIIIAKAFKLEAPANTTLPFTDVYPAYKNQIAALFTNGITSGTSKSTFGGSSNVTRGQLAQFVVKAENVSKSEDVENSTTFTIESISDSKIQTSQGELAVNSSLQSIFKSSNAAALKNAEVKAVVSNGEVKSISSITLNASGTANTPVVFDGSKATISGDVKVNADYVALNNVTVNGDLTLTAKVVNKFASKGLVTNGELIVEKAPASPVASINGVVAAETKGPEVELLESTIKSILAERNGVKISSDSKLPELKISAEVTNIEVNANVAKVTVNVTLKIEITGKGTLDQVTIEKAEEIALLVAGIVKELVVANQTTKVDVGVNVQIEQLVVPEGKKVDEVIKNFNQVRNNIKEVKDAKGATVNKPSTGGGSGGGSNNGGGNNNKNFSLSIMHTNDTHASLDNAPKTVTAVKEVRAEKPDALLLNAGDVFSGTLYFNEFQGQADLKMMNLMGYDAMTFGNHEFDLGSSEDGHQGLVDFIKGANFPFVSSNVNFTADEKFTGLFSDLISSEPENGKIYNGIIKEINGEKVGIFGLTTAETKDLSSPGAITFEDYKVEAEKAVKAFEDKGVDKIIAITHIGYDDNAAIDNDLTLAKEVEGIDVIVGGHSHTTLKEPIVVKEDATPTVIVQAGANNSNLGLLDVEFDKNGVVVGQAGKLIAIGDQVEDAEAKKILTPYKEKVQELAEQPIGVTADVALLNPRVGDEGNTTGESVRKNETILGNLITDGMLVKAKETTGKNVIMAFQNGGGIRSSIDAGPITVGEVITVLPFGNTLAVMDVTGAELKEAFEISLGKLPGENGGFLHVAGAKVQFDSSKPSGERVISLQYQDATGNYIDILDSETYTVATNAFTAQGGDGYTPFAKAYAEGRVTDLGLSDWQNFAEHLQSLDSIPTQIEGRIVDVAGEVVDPEQPGTDIVEDPGKKPAEVVTTKDTLTVQTSEDTTKLTVKQIARYDSGHGPTGTEILAYDVTSHKAFVTNGAVGGFDILSFADLTDDSTDLKAIQSEKRVVIADYGIAGAENITSIAAHPTLDLIAISAYGEKTDRGYIVFADKNGKYVNHVQVGYLPDMVTFTPDGAKAIVANEGEPNDALPLIDPAGSISIIDIPSYQHTELTFTTAMLDDKVRMTFNGEDENYLEQLEPEYVTVSEDSKTAYVSLQENNAIATVNLETKEIISVKGLGVIDHSENGNEMDANKEDKTANIVKTPILTYHMPDAIDTFTIDGTEYIITPNEGDSRDWEGYSEEGEIVVKDDGTVVIEGKVNGEKVEFTIDLNAEKYKGYDQEELNSFDLSTLEGYKTTLESGLSDDGSVYEAIYGYGGRSFSIFNATTMEEVFDSGSEFEKLINQLTPDYFNTNHAEVKKDNRSDDKGPEPETAVTGTIGSTTYGFIALERYSGIMVYDLSDVTNPKFVALISSRDFVSHKADGKNFEDEIEDGNLDPAEVAGIAGDVSPEGLLFISAENSPTGNALLVATHEISGTVAVYELSGTLSQEPPVAELEVSSDNFSGTEAESKIYETNVLVKFDGTTTKLENAIVKGNLTLVGFPNGEYSISNMKVEGTTIIAE
nr:choice-of-anchor I family protein [Lysinibacillus timonensis]